MLCGGYTGWATHGLLSQGRISVEWLDKSDCVASWQSEKLAAVVFCTSDCLPQLRNIDGETAFHSFETPFASHPSRCIIFLPRCWEVFPVVLSVVR